MIRSPGPNHPEGREPFDNVRRLQRKLFVAAKRHRGRRFHALYLHIWRSDVLREAWRRVQRNRGAAGVDGVTLAVAEEYGVARLLSELADDLRSGRYRPSPVLRRHIPKAAGGTRPLGIPTVKDRIAQMAAKLVLEPIFEADFLSSSYGYRPKRSALHALETIRETANAGAEHVLDADIADFFGSLDHEVLMALVAKRISDRRVQTLIRRWLRAGVMEDGLTRDTVAGVPQGGVISPLLANIYLHVLDRVWEQRCAHLGTLVRYADDLVVLARSPEALVESERRVASTLGHLKLRLHPDKTRTLTLTNGREGFEFLGHYLRKRVSGRLLQRGRRRYYLQRWPSVRSLRRVRRSIHELTDQRWSGVKDVRVLIEKLNPVLRGWGEYFRTGNAARKFLRIDSYVTERLHHFLVKRAGRNLRADRANQWTKEWFWGQGLHRLRGTVRYPKPSMLHEKTIGEPDAGKSHVRCTSGTVSVLGVQVPCGGDGTDHKPRATAAPRDAVGRKPEANSRPEGHESRTRRGGPGEAGTERRSPAIKGPQRKRGGCARKDADLIRRGLGVCPQMPVYARRVRRVIMMPVHARRDRRVGRDREGRQAVVRRRAVSRGHSTGGDHGRREGPNTTRRPRTRRLVGTACNAANPARGLGNGTGR